MSARTTTSPVIRGGFTLIEILVALFVFAIVGVISSQLLSQSIQSHGQLSDRGKRLADVHRAMQVLQRDIMQISHRNIRDEYGDPQPPLLIGTEGAIEFTRSGWRNPLLLPRAEVQRVGYLLQDNILVRGYWPVLDRAQDSEPAYQNILQDVERLEFYVVDNAGNEHTFWPQPGLPSDLKRLAILMRIELPGMGVVERIWEIPSG